MRVLKKFKLSFTVCIYFIAVLIFLSFCIVKGIQIYNNYLTENQEDKEFASCIFINGVCLHDKGRDEAKDAILNKLSEDKKDKNLNILCDDKIGTIYLKDLEFENNVDEVLDYASFLSKHLNNRNIFFNVFLKTINLQVDENLNEDSLNVVVKDLSLRFNDKMEECSVECFSPNKSELFSYTQGKDGYEISEEELKEKIINAIDKKSSDVIKISRYEIKNNTTIDDAMSRTKLLGSFKTTLTSSYNRNKNISLSLSAVNGTIINSGEIFSFNDVVGERSKERGYLLAPALSNGQTVDSYGGGVCQASTTIYGAAIRSNMEIVERQCHSLKSRYVAVGLDSTVSYDSVDLKFKNNLAYPIYIKTYTLGSEIGCEIYGARPDWYDDIKVVSGYVSGSSTQAYAKRLFYKNNTLVKEEYLPSSVYKK